LSQGDVNTADNCAGRIIFLTLILCSVIGRIQSPAAYVNLNLNEDDVLLLLEGDDDEANEKNKDGEDDNDDEGEIAILLNRVKEAKKKTGIQRAESKRKGKVLPTAEQDDILAAEVEAVDEIGDEIGDERDGETEKQPPDDKVEVASKRSRNSLFSVDKKKISQSITKKDTAKVVEKVSLIDEDDWGVVSKNKSKTAVSQGKKSQSSKPGKDASGASGASGQGT
jgi:hypothetical protein